MIERMPQRPKKMSTEDRENLAVIGHRIEMWNTARSGEGSMDERRAELAKQLQQQIGAMSASPATVSPIEFQELLEDAERVIQFNGDEQAFDELCASHEEYYKQVRDEYIQTHIGDSKKNRQR